MAVSHRMMYLYQDVNKLKYIISGFLNMTMASTVIRSQFSGMGDVSRNLLNLCHKELRQSGSNPAQQGVPNKKNSDCMLHIEI